jgi:phage repressor protein C with HTH and peptisase S24 domain
MNLGSVASRVRNGEAVTFVATGNSMTPRIKSGDTVTVAPRTAIPKPGEVVLARVNGRWMLHKVSAVSPTGRRVQISNNHGRVNGWTAGSNVVGVLQD